MNRTLISALLTLFAAAVLASGTGKQPEDQMPTAPPQASSGVSFEQLDRNGDGAISRAEAEAHRQLVQQWQELDQDANGSLDQSELSAFEFDTEEER